MDIYFKRKKIRTDIIAIIFVLALLLLSCTFFYIGHIYSTLKEESKDYLQEVSKQSAKTLNLQINSNIKYLNTLAVTIGEKNTFNISESINILKKETAKSSFSRMAILFPNKTASSTDGMGGDFTDEPYFKQSIAGKACVMQPAEDRLGHGIMVNTYSVPIYHKGTIIGVLMANIPTNIYQKLIAVDVFKGQTSSFVINNYGQMLMSAARDIRDTNPYSFLFVQGSEFYNSRSGQIILNDFSHGNSGAIDYNKDGEHLFISYAPIGINNWFLLTSTPSRVASSHINEILLQIIMMCFACALLLLALFLYIIYSDEQKKRQLTNAAYCDPITKGDNWNKFQLDANQFLDQKSSQKQAIIILDVNKFKAINDYYGHTTGDKILQKIYAAMQFILNENQPLCRYSGDRFVFILNYNQIQEIDTIIKKLIQTVETYCKEVCEKITCAFGIYQVHDYTMPLRKMVDRATIAVQTVKNKHENTIAVFDNSMRAKILHNKQIEDHMEDALENHEFIVYLQPKVNLKKDQIDSAEALVRWNFPKLGIVSPGFFIPLFEKNGFITKLDFYVLEEVCKRIRCWINAGVVPYPIAVNISRIHLMQNDFIEKLCSILKKYEISPCMIELELTESAIFDNMVIMKQLLEDLHALGFIISMDDFGSGYSSLHTLKDLPIDTLKIDRGFFVINNPNGRSRSRIVVRNVISMAKELNITTIAEGIEEKEQVDYLKDVGCDVIQGFYFGKPMPMEEYEEKVFHTHI